MDLNDIIVSNGVRVLVVITLEANGRMDAADGKSLYDGWQEVAKECGYDPAQRTPAREAYEDGYYSYKRT